MPSDDSEKQDLIFLSRSLEALQPDSPPRKAYLARLAELVRKGEYHVDAETLADEIIRKTKN